MKHATQLMLVVTLVATSVSVVMAGRGSGGGGTGDALSEAEKTGLIELREEEKLARDVYLALAETWNLPIFGNIAASEQRHMDSVKNLLDKYGVADPAAGKGQGEFTNPAFTTLYKQLVAQGNESPKAALQVGVTIEKMDIADIQALLKDVTHLDIERVYGNLLSGSYNHLDAFQSNLESR